jgi:hypothetical protein
MLMQPELIETQDAEEQEFDTLVRAALVCGCASCRHAVQIWSLKEQAEKIFTRAHAELAGAKRLRFVVGKSAA